MAKQPIESVALTELFTKMNEQWDLFMINHADLAKGNKSAAKKARAALGEIKKLVTPYRKESVIAVKGQK